MNPAPHIVITTISPPGEVIANISAALKKLDGTLFIVGDKKSPSASAYGLPHTVFIGVDDPSLFKLAKLLPVNSYSRKNIGYLHAASRAPDCIIETDDDNVPWPDFWKERSKVVSAQRIANPRGFVNAYRYFTDEIIWPRGLPLDEINSLPVEAKVETLLCPIQQSLADRDPDVDAIYRLTRKLSESFVFKKKPPAALDRGSWCPFNSQNTTFFKEAWHLLYLPSFCNFRMCDIWRSFVAQRCLWEMDARLAFTWSTVYQMRNEHDLMRDFEDEIPGYLHNRKITETLARLSLKKGSQHGVSNMVKCYAALVDKFLPAKELKLLQAWIDDITPFL